MDTPVLVLCVCGLLGGLIVSWSMLRKDRIASLRRQAREMLELGTADRQSLAAGIARLTNDPSSLAELGAYSTITAAEYLWSWAAIAPSVVKAAAFSSSAAIKSGLDFASFIHFHYDSLSAAGKDGFLSRLLGYVGEQQVADALLSHGHTVQMAETASHPIWDLLVDGHVANVKTVADIASVKAEALAHPHVLYLVPQDTHGHAVGNIMHVAGFKYDAAHEALKEGIAAAKGESASHAVGVHLPWITIGFAAYRNLKAIPLGKDPLVAAKHFVIESVGRGTGVVVGAQVGGYVGSLVGPIGSLVGAVGGGLAGALFGGALAEEYKRKPLEQALENLQRALHDFGSAFAPMIDSIRGYIEAPLSRMRQNLQQLEEQVRARHLSWRWWLWPDYYTVLLEETAEHGKRAVEEEQINVDIVRGVLLEAQHSGRYEKVGLLMANAPIVCELVGFDAGKLSRVQAARSKALYERKQLNPALVLPPDDLPQNAPYPAGAQPTGTSGAIRYGPGPQTLRGGAASITRLHTASGAAPGSSSSPSGPTAATSVPLIGGGGWKFALHRGPNTIGRETADIRLADRTVSRRHATISLAEGCATIVDHGSTNGTRVAGQALQPNEPRPLYDGDEICFGNTVLTVTLPDSVPRAEDGKPAACARLVASDGTHRPLRKGVNTLGRSYDNDVVVRGDPYVSGRHAEIWCANSGCSITHVGSTNGTFVRSKHLVAGERHELVTGDEIRMGQSVFVFETAALPATGRHPGSSAPVTS